MFNLVKEIFNYRNEIKKLKNCINSLKFDLRHSLAISEKYIPLMKVSDKIQLLILRRNISAKE